MSFALDQEYRDEFATIRLSGELDMAGAPRLHALISKLIRDGQPRILVDLYDVSFCDSAGLNAFVQGDKRCAARGGWLRLDRAQGHVARVLELSGVAEILNYHGAEEHPDRPGTP